jgi:gamma-glutamylcyclotransferase (GGCT)/AIG2-like uncharacterized protein YtfP
MTRDSIQAVFVYGTLKRDQIRGGMWPRKPTSIRVAITKGHLFDLGPYPALLEGDDWIAGELWEFYANDMPSVLEALDDIEGYRPGATNNLYERKVVEAVCCDDEGDEDHADAYTYFYAGGQRFSSQRRIVPGVVVFSKPCCAWPDSLTDRSRVTLDA